AKHFNVKTALVINKYDLNLDMTRKIEQYCEKEGVKIIGKVSFDKSVVEAMVSSKTVIEYSDSKAKEEIISIWERLQKEL
ncbi:MAG: (4Fe-4S)-binding protein, partial [Candidatus Orphnella occulta]|nr:(4Fe-4S)-binding protein [Candidatus Orphnella occulta]